MNAKEAREKAEQVLNVSAQESIKDVLNTIRIAVHSGDLQTNYYKSLTVPVQDYFKEQGYTLKYNYEYREDSYYTISW